MQLAWYDKKTAPKMKQNIEKKQDENNIFWSHVSSSLGCSLCAAHKEVAHQGPFCRFLAALQVRFKTCPLRHPFSMHGR